MSTFEIQECGYTGHGMAVFTTSTWFYCAFMDFSTVTIAYTI